jgi:Flp pilus assembly pilin Flp
MTSLWLRLRQRNDAEDLIEYGLLLGIITVVSAIAIVSIGGKVSTYLTNLNSIMP